MLLLIYSFAGLLLLGNAAKLPSHFKTCPRNDPNFQNCLKGAIEDAVKKLVNGDSKLGLLPLDPLTIIELKLPRNGGAITFNPIFKNLKIKGVPESKVVAHNTNLKNFISTTDTFSKQLTIDGDYEMNGKILQLPVNGKGKFHMELYNLEGKSILSGAEKKVNGKSYYDLKKYNYTYKVSGVKIHFENLFNGDKTLGETTNRVLNENWEEISKIMQPGVEEALSIVFKQYAKTVFDKVPLDELYPVKK